MWDLRHTPIEVLWLEFVAKVPFKFECSIVQVSPVRDSEFARTVTGNGQLG